MCGSTYSLWIAYSQGAVVAADRVVHSPIRKWRLHGLYLRKGRCDVYRLNYDDKPKKPREMAPAFVETELFRTCACGVGWRLRLEGWSRR